MLPACLPERVPFRHRCQAPFCLFLFSVVFPGINGKPALIDSGNILQYPLAPIKKYSGMSQNIQNHETNL